MQKSLWHQPRNRPRPLTSAVIAQKISNFTTSFLGSFPWLGGGATFLSPYKYQKLRIWQILFVCLKVSLYRQKHRHAKRARVIFLWYYSENGLDVGKSTNASYKHKDQNVSFFLVLALMFMLQQVKMKNRSRRTQAQRYLPHLVMFGQWKYWTQITSCLNSLEDSDDFACAWTKFHFHLVHPCCLLLCLHLCLRR